MKPLNIVRIIMTTSVHSIIKKSQLYMSFQMREVFTVLALDDYRIN